MSLALNSSRPWRPGQRIHLAAILCTVAAVALVMAPAAVHRQTEAREVSQRFIETSSRLLKWSMFPLAIGTTLDVYLISRVILSRMDHAIGVAVLALGLFGWLWVVLPASFRPRRKR